MTTPRDTKRQNSSGHDSRATLIVKTQVEMTAPRDTNRQNPSGNDSRATLTEESDQFFLPWHGQLNVIKFAYIYINIYTYIYIYMQI